MLSKTLKKRFKPNKEELTKLLIEFNSEVIPLLENLHKTTYWILLDDLLAKKLIKKVFYQAIENCYVTKNSADWTSWIYRIWIRELLQFHSEKENDTKTNFDFIDLTEINLKEDNNIFSYSQFNDQLNISLKKMPAVLRIPLMIKENLSLNYGRIAELIDVPEEVIATRIYRGRKLLFLFLLSDFDFENKKRTFIPTGNTKPIFILRNFAMLADNELSDLQKKKLDELTKGNESYQAENLLQGNIKSVFMTLTADKSAISKIKAEIKEKARKHLSIN